MAANEGAGSASGTTHTGHTGTPPGQGAQVLPRKRIVVCCDGTWQRLDARYPTNPVRVAKAVLPIDPVEGIVQIVYHLDGVGTGRGTGALARWSDRLLGGLMGSGLTETVAEAYRHLVFGYRPGDEIYIFGYSRGAYTARSLAGMIRNCGILSRAHADKVGQALALYRSQAPADAPDGENALAFRAAYAPGVVTSDGEIAWRARRLPGIDWRGVVPLAIAYIGVWDTVGSLGVPEEWTLSGLFNRRHRFHDTCLSSRVLAARHAVAIDERRRNFRPALWDNVAELNRGAPAAPDAPYQQRWFPGVHAAVGGGGDDAGLASLALVWVLEGAMRSGLALDDGALEALAAVGDPLAPLSGRSRPAAGVLASLLRFRPIDRTGPAAAHELSDAARARWALDPGYRPRPLDALRPLLEART